MKSTPIHFDRKRKGKMIDNKAHSTHNQISLRIDKQNPITACWQAKSLTISCKFCTVQLFCQIFANLAKVCTWCQFCKLAILQAKDFARSCKSSKHVHCANIARECFCKMVQISQLCTRLQTKLQGCATKPACQECCLQHAVIRFPTLKNR